MVVISSYYAVTKKNEAGSLYWNGKVPGYIVKYKKQRREEYVE